MRLLACLALFPMVVGLMAVGLLASGCVERPAPLVSPIMTPASTHQLQADVAPTGLGTAAPGVAGFDLEVVIDPPGSGFVAVVPPFGPYAPGGTVTLSVIRPRVPPYVFSHWSGDGSGSERAVRVVMDSSKRVVARFINPYVTPTASP